MEDKKPVSLPENAQRELKPGEKYVPILDPAKKYAEVTPYSVCLGILMVVLFSAAAAYLGLKVGQVFEAAIPIAIIAVGLTSALKKNDGLAQNVIIQSIGGCSGAVVAGAIFTLPAIYILGVEVNFWQMFLSSLLGGVLGILFLIPFRKYFVKEMHGKYPFPEATATTQVLVSGESGGSSAKTLVWAGLIGGLYDFLVATFGTWAETLSTTVMGWGQAVADKAKVVLKINTGAAVLGLGYIVGLKYAFIICCGSLLVWLVIIPLMNLIWGGSVIDLMGTGVMTTIGEMAPEQIFKDYARHIGIGGIATAGIIGIIKSFGVIKSAAGLAVSEFKRKPGAVADKVERTDEDLPMKTIVWGVVIALLAIFAYFAFGGVVNNVWQAIVGLLIVAIVSFLFTTVAANAIAIVGTNPVSGMTLMTLIIASLILVAVGLKGNAGMAAALIIGGVVCTALSVAGSFITDLKIGYWRRGLGRDGVRRDAGAEQDLRLHRRPGPRGPAGQCHGGGHPADDERRRRPLAAVRHWRGHRHPPHALQGAGPALRPGHVHGLAVRPGHVHPHRPEPSAAGGRRDLLVCEHALQGRSGQHGPSGKRHTHRLRLHRRRRPHGCGERHPPLCERGPFPHGVERGVRRGNRHRAVPAADCVYGLFFNES